MSSNQTENLLESSLVELSRYEYELNRLYKIALSRPNNRDYLYTIRKIKNIGMQIAKLSEQADAEIKDSIQRTCKHTWVIDSTDRDSHTLYYCVHCDKQRY
jgi:hypothetical protein